MTITILRITNLPTDTKNPGRHSEMLSELPDADTVFVTDSVLGRTRLAAGGHRVHELPLSQRRIYSLFKLARLIIKTRPDIVAIHLYWFIPLALLRIGPAYVYHIHGLDQKLFHHRMINTIWLKLFHRIFSVTPLADERVTYIPNPAYRELIQAQKEYEDTPKTKKLAFVGRLDRNKNCSFAINAFESSGLSERGYELCIIGDGDELVSLREKYKDVLSVRFLGRLPYEQVLMHLAESKVLIMSSLSEGYPKVAIEANQLKANVVAPRYPCFQASSSPLFFETFCVEKVAQLLRTAVETDWVKLDFKSEADVMSLYADYYNRCRLTVQSRLSRLGGEHE